MKNKILPILCIFILISFLFINNNVFAAETDTLIVDGYNMSDIYNYYSPNDAFFIYIAPDTTSYFFYKPAYVSEYCYNAVKDGLICYYNSNWSTNVGGHDFFSFNTETLKFDYGWHGNLSATGHNTSNMQLVYSSKGIYNQDHTTFFLNPPAPTPTTLAGVLAEANPNKTFQTMMSGIIPYLIAFLVGLVAFWKAWQLLLKELRKA